MSTRYVELCVQRTWRCQPSRWTDSRQGIANEITSIYLFICYLIRYSTSAVKGHFDGRHMSAVKNVTDFYFRSKTRNVIHSADIYSTLNRGRRCWLVCPGAKLSNCKCIIGRKLNWRRLCRLSNTSRVSRDDGLGDRQSVACGIAYECQVHMLL